MTDAAAKVLQETTVPIVMTRAAWQALHETQSEHPRAECLRVQKALSAARTAVLDRLRELGRTRFEMKVRRRSQPLVIEFHESDDDGELVATIMIDQSHLPRSSATGPI